MEDKEMHQRIKVVENDLKYKNNRQDDQKTKVLDKAVNELDKFLSLFDLGGKSINLKYNGKELYKSFLGGIISIASFAGIIIYVVTSFIFFYQRTSPIFSSISENQPSPDEMFLKNYSSIDWIIGVDIRNKDNSIYHENYYNISVLQAYRQGPGIEEYIIPLVDCTKSVAFQHNVSEIQRSADIKTYFDLYKLNNSLCFQMNETGSSATRLKGSDMTDDEYYVKILVQIGKYNESCRIALNESLKGSSEFSAHDSKCKEVRDRLNDATVKFYFQHQVFLTNDSIPNPVELRVGYQSFSIQRYFSKKSRMFAQNNRVVDYYNILSTSPSTNDVFTYSEGNTDIDFVETEEFGMGPFLEIQIKPALLKNTYTRKYMNIKEFFISIVSIVNGLLAGASVLGKFFNEMLFRLNMINKSFVVLRGEDYSVNEAELKKTQAKLDKLKQDKKALQEQMKLNQINESEFHDKSSRILKNSKDNSDEKDNSLREIELEKKVTPEKNEKSRDETQITERNKNVNDVCEYIRLNEYAKPELKLQPKSKEFKVFKMTFPQLVQQLLPCCNKKKEIKNKKRIYDECGTIIESYFDIERIVDILREYEELRNVVLNESEYNILKQLTIPIIYEGKKTYVKKLPKATISADKDKAYVSYIVEINKLIDRKRVSPIEENLLKLHNTSMKYQMNIEEEEDEN